MTDPRREPKLEAVVTPDAEKGTLQESQTIAQRHPKLQPITPAPLLAQVGAQQIDKAGLLLIENFEGYLEHAYWDAYGHVWTVGYGETQGVGPNSTMTRAQAEADLRGRLANGYEPAVRSLGVPLNQNQFDALCSFVWNLGPGSMDSSWTIGRLLRAHNYLGAADSMMTYVYSGGQRLQGLVNRREQERALFLKPVSSPPPPSDPHHYDRFYTDVELEHTHQHLNERAIVKEYDKLRVHGIWNRRKLKPVRVDLGKLTTHVWEEAHKTKPPQWGTRWLGWRYQELAKRNRGEKVNS